MAISNPGFNFPILSRVLISPMFKVILFLIDSVISESEILFSVKIISYGANPAFRAMAHSPGETLSIPLIPFYFIIFKIFIFVFALQA